MHLRHVHRPATLGLAAPDAAHPTTPHDPFAVPAARAGDRLTVRSVAGWIGIGVLLALLVAYRPMSLGGPTSFVVVSGTSMEPVLATGDLAIALRSDRYAVGDIVSYAPSADPAGRIIHRVIGGDSLGGYITRGDARGTADPDRPSPAAIDGKVVAVVPGAGLAIALLRTPLVIGAILALVVLSFAWGDLRRRSDRR